MKRELAEAYYHSPVILCPLCDHLEGIPNTDEGEVDIKLDKAMKKMIEHLIDCHTNEEAESLGWL